MKLFTLLVGLLVLSAPAQAACDNPFFPAKPGSSKTFTTQDKKTYTIRVVSASANGFTLRFAYTDPVRVLEVPYTCTAQGLTAPSLGAGSGFGPSASITTQVKASNGVVIPAEGRWRVGASWTYSTEGTMTTNDKQQGQIVYTFKGMYTFRIVAQEKVKVPAGTFQAFKVVLTQKGEFGAKGVSTPINSSITQWYARGIGLVRQESQYGVHELISFKP